MAAVMPTAAIPALADAHVTLCGDILEDALCKADAHLTPWFVNLNIFPLQSARRKPDNDETKMISRKKTEAQLARDGLRQRGRGARPAQADDPAQGRDRGGARQREPPAGPRLGGVQRAGGGGRRAAAPGTVALRVEGPARLALADARLRQEQALQRVPRGAPGGVKERRRVRVAEHVVSQRLRLFG